MDANRQIQDFWAIAGPIIKTLALKNQDYGNSYDRLREEFGPTAFYVRLFDKLYRLQQVDKNGDHVGGPATDTLQDIIGYCILELRFRKKGVC